jgi:glycosyltransferase involved in cell wall biosynthesis
MNPPGSTPQRKRLCLISHGQPAGNPRLVRDAIALSEAGHEVRVVTAQYHSKLIEHDRRLADGALWQYEPVDLRGNKNWSHRWDYLRLRRRISAGLANWLPTAGLVARGYAYGNPEVSKLAAREPADLYVAYQHNSLPAAVWAARRHNAGFAVDAQDLLADCSAELTKLAISLERTYLKDCAYISTMSAPAAERLQQTNMLCCKPIVLHNTPGLKERNGVRSPVDRPLNEPVSLYWFGQTIGPHSCAEQVLKAMRNLCRPVKLVLRGNPIERYVKELRASAETLGVGSQLIILPREEPTEMVRLAADHDILLGTQPGQELFNQMAIGNKVFTGMMAGLALALSDTIAHRELLASAPGCGFLFPDGDVESLALNLNRLLSDHDRLQQMKLASWQLAETRFNWEMESKTLLWTIDQSLSDSRLDLAGAA